jgi:WD40 repeat protein/serine/threonine protein kinase
MARRTDGTRDLLFGLFALQRGLIDPAQLVAAFETWCTTKEEKLAEVLLRQGAVDQSVCVLVEGLAARQLEEEEWASQGIGDSATVAYVGAQLPDQDRGGSDRSTVVGERYRIVRPHARGGLGEIFIALDPELDRQVALKELQTFNAHDPVSQSRFLLEAKVTGRLEHPGIVPVYGIGRHADGRPYYAMRLIEGETLQQAIERFHQPESSQRQPAERELTFRRLLRSLIDTCNAVAYAHSRGVLHRDLKPENIMLGPFGETLVVDWGVAKPMGGPDGEPAAGSSPGELGDESSLTRPGSAIGTPQYMSPEQAAGDLDRVEPASDVYGLGATLYCLLVGHGPFPSGGVADVLKRVSRGIFPAPRRLRKSIDPTLEAICLKAMSLRPEDRHATPLALAEEIEAWLADVRYRGEHEKALNDVRRSLARLCIERAQNLFGREMPGEGMLWLARALENIPSDSPGLDRVVRSSLAGWHAATKQIERCFEHGGDILGVAFGPDGRRLASVSTDRTARLWDIATGALLSPPIRHEQTVRAVAFSPDGRVVVTSCDDGTVMRWDGVTGTAVGASIQHDAPVSTLRFSADGSKIATASRSRSPCFWDAATGQPIGSLAGHDAIVLAIAFDPDGSRLAVAGDDGRVWFWDPATGTLLEPTLRHEAAVVALAFSPDGRKLVTGCLDGRARLWDPNLGTTLAEFPYRTDVGCVDYSPSGRSVALACPDGTARLWDAESGRPIGEPLSHRGRVDCLAFNSSGTIVATGSQDGSVRLWDADTGLPIGPPFAHQGAVRSLVFSPDTRRLATASSDGLVRCWRVPAPIAGDVERISCWVRVTTALEFDDGAAIGRIDQLALWELRRRLQELGGAPVK